MAGAAEVDWRDLAPYRFITVGRLSGNRLILDLGDVSDVDAIHLGTIAALCDLADDHHVVVFLAATAVQLRRRMD